VAKFVAKFAIFSSDSFSR